MTVLELLIFFIEASLLGLVTVTYLWPAETRGSMLLRAGLSMGLGLGLTSLFLFLWLLIFGASFGALRLFQNLLLFFLAVLFLYALKTGRLTFRREASITAGGPRYVIYLRRAFLALLAFSLVSFVLLSMREPHGGWDAWAIWNLHARFIFRGGENWRGLFSNLIEWSHPDYPLLIPMAVVSGWIRTGFESTIVPAAIAFAFTFSTVLVLWSSITLLRGGSQGMLAGLSLAGTTSFVTNGASQCADVPLAFYLLSTLVLLTFYDRTGRRGLLVLAGLFAGMAAWTKNEGLLMLCALIAARISLAARADGLKESVRESAYFLAGLAPVLACVVYFKLALAPQNDLVSAQGIETIARFADPARYAEVLKAYLVHSIRFTNSLISLPLFILYFYLAGAGDEQEGTRRRFLPAALALILAGYFLVYISTPKDLAWHLKTSLSRLLIQLWPGFIFYFFFLVKAPVEMTGVEKNEELA